MGLTDTAVTDTHGNPITGGRDAVDRYDVALDHLLAYRDDLVDAMTSLAEDEPAFPMGQILAAYMSLTSTDWPDLAGARQLAAHLDTLALNDREVAHRDAIRAWISGDWYTTARLLGALTVRWPADLLGLLVGHQLDFFLGDAGSLRDRIGRSLYAIDPDHPHIGYVRGMYAFGLEESGNYALAEQHGLAAVERNPDDVWATHAVTHVYEMQGRVDDGLRFLRDSAEHWTEGNLFAVHNSWHLALFMLEAERFSDALAIYDRSLHNESSVGVPLEMLDASALLWRLFVDGIDDGGRFGPLADAWTTRLSNEPWYVFNDLHAVIALCGAGRLPEARAVIERLDRYVESTDDDGASNVWMTTEVGLPACRSVVAFTEGRHGDVVAELAPARATLARFGGSHAQRDVLQRTLLVSATRDGQVDLATALTSERLAARETSVWSWRRRAEIARSTGDDSRASAADGRADAAATRFAAAAN